MTSRGAPAHPRPAFRLASTLALATFLCAAGLSPAAAEVRRPLQRGADPVGATPPGAGAARTGARSSTAAATFARIVTVDSHSYTGAENEIWAPDRRNVFVAYKRFLRNPYDPGGDIVPARLRVARSGDGGRTWTSRVVDPNAPEPGDVIDQSVSIDGYGSTVYVAYLADSSLKVAKSADGGATWTIQTLASDGTGEFNAIEVVDANTVLIATERPSFTDEALRMFATTDGGGVWTDSLIDTFGWYTSLDTSPSGDIWVCYYHPGDTDLYAATAGAPAGPWTSGVVAGAPADGRYTGLGAALSVSPDGDIFASYEDFGSGGGVLVSSSKDGGVSWSPVPVDAGGWNTAIAAMPDPVSAVTDVFVTYWHVRWKPTQIGRARMAFSLDGGLTWSILQVPESGYVNPYLDLAAPSTGVQYVSYQVGHLADASSILRVARIDGAA